MTQKVWFQLVEKSGNELGTLSNPGSYDSRGVLEGVDVHDLKVYKDGDAFRRSALSGNTSIRQFGKTEESAMLVEVPRVWYKLVSGIAGNPKPITYAAFLPLADWRCIKELKHAVKAAHGDKILKDIDAEYLKVYTESSREPLDGKSEIGSLSGTMSHPLLVEVPKLWYRLVNRKREAITGVATVFLSDMNNVEDFRDAVKKHRASLLEDIDAKHLNVYTESSREPLDGKAEIGSLGDAKNETLDVMVPKIWYQLFDAGTRKSITSAASVPIPNSSNVEELCVAVKQRNTSIELDGVHSSKLRVYKTLEVYGDTGAVPKEGSLQSDELIGENGMTASTALIVEVPTMRSVKRLKTLWT